MKTLSILLASLWFTIGSPALGAEQPPSVAGMTIIAQDKGFCPDGASIDVTLYDSDPNDPEAAIFVWNVDGALLLMQIKPGDRVWVEAHKRFYPFSEVVQKWPTPCDIPRASKGVGI